MGPCGLPHGTALCSGVSPCGRRAPPVCGLRCCSEAARAALRSADPHCPRVPPLARPSQASPSSGVGDRFLHLVGKVACFRTVVSFCPQPCCSQPFVPVPWGSVALSLCRADSAASLLTGPSSCSMSSRLLFSFP